MATNFNNSNKLPGMPHAADETFKVEKGSDTSGKSGGGDVGSSSGLVEKSFYVGEHGWVTIVCPHCGKAKDLEATKLPSSKYKLRVKCKCGNVFVANLESRKKYRKNVEIPGEYLNHTNEDWGKIIIHDISMGGIGFSTVKRHDIMVGDHVELTFTLDTHPPRKVTKEVRILRVNKYTMGSQYIMRVERDPDIGLYLMD